jgi:hypothetical protein
MNVRGLRLHRRNAAWMRSTHAGSTRLHPDFGPPDHGLPFDVDDTSHADVSVTFTYADESDAGLYPFGPETQIEGGSDRHALIIDRDTRTLYELFAARWNGGSPTAGSGAIFDLGSNALRPAGWTSADAAGLPIFPGLVRYDEVRSGSIDHAIRSTVACTYHDYVWPARHRAGTNDRRCPPMGARFRLRNSFPMKGFSSEARVILRAMKRFGMIVADNGSDWYFQGSRDPGWTDELLDELKTVPASSFQAVATRGCRVSAGSAAFAYGPGCPAP